MWPNRRHVVPPDMLVAVGLVQAQLGGSPWLGWRARPCRGFPPWEQLLDVNHPPRQGVGLGFNCPEQPRLGPTTLELVPRLEP